jgi:hypothetical protein
MGGCGLQWVSVKVWVMCRVGVCCVLTVLCVALDADVDVAGEAEDGGECSDSDEDDGQRPLVVGQTVQHGPPVQGGDEGQQRQSRVGQGGRRGRGWEEGQRLSGVAAQTDAGDGEGGGGGGTGERVGRPRGVAVKGVHHHIQQQPTQQRHTEREPLTRSTAQRS